MAPDGSDQIDGDPENEAALLAYDLSIDPRQEEVFLRHRSPSEQLPESKGQQEINRILEDSAVQTYHAVPVDQEQQHQKKQLWRKVRIEWGDIAMKPFLTCRGYSLGKIRNDLVAGITVALVSVPLSMSYAKLAGLPPYYGLYACFVPPMVYPIFGTSRHMAVGTAALVSLLVSAGVGPIVQAEGLTDENSQEYINRYAALAIQCSFLAGIINLGMGLLRLGFVTQFLSRAIISGFTSGAAIIIATSQLKHLFGYSAPSSDLVYEILVYLFENIDQFDWRTFLMGSLSIVALISLRIICQNETILSKYPRIKWLRALGPMLISAIAILLVYFCDLVDKGIPTVGAIPSGLPSITVEYWTPVESRLWPVVLSMVIVGFVQAIAISKRIAYKHGYEIDPSQELVGLGLASLVGGVFQSYPATGALGQSAVNDEIGAESGVASLVTGLSVMTVLLCLTPVFELMPLTVLAAIVISFVINMFVSQVLRLPY
jgi:high affinity sulfate transporter 1